MSQQPTDNSVRSSLTQLIAGVIIGFDNLGRAVALATLVFAGSLYGGAPLAMSVFMLAGALGTALLLLPRFFVGPVFSNVQNTTVAILLPAMAAIMASDLSELTQIATVFAVLGGTAVMTGAAMILMGIFDLGRLVRLVPFPVAAGYLAASGALLAVSAVNMICSNGTCLRGVLGGGNLVLAVVFASALGLITMRWRSIGLVTVVLGALALFYATLLLLGLSGAEARAAGYLPLIAEARGDIGPEPSIYRSVRLDLVFDALPLMAAATIVSLFAAMLNVTGVEIAVRRDVRTRRELARGGVVNIVTGALGSTVSFISASNTSAAMIVGAAGRIPGVVTCVILVAGAAFSGHILTFVPPFLSAGLLLFFGVSILNRWWIFTRHQQSLVEWLLSALIVIASLVVGMPAAVLIGMVLASLIFAVTYARLPVIRSTTDIAHRRSTVDRGPAQSAHLTEIGGEVAVVALQGYLFFGSIEQLTRHIRALLEREQPVRQVILDFQRVSRMDASSLVALKKLDILASEHEARVVLAGLANKLAADISRARLIEADTALTLSPAVDVAMEEAENGLILRMEPIEASETVTSALTRIIGDADAAGRLVAAMDREEFAAGDTLIKQGDRSGDMFMLETGALSVYLNTTGGDRIRVRKQRPGTIVGEIASYAGVARTADVVADVPSVVYRLTEDRLGGFHDSEPDLAAYWHRAMATALADKLDRTNTLLGQNAS